MAIAAPDEIEETPMFIVQAATWKLSLQLTDANDAPMSLVGCTAKMQIRRKENHTANLYYTLDTTTSRIVIDELNGIVYLKIPEADTALFTWNAGYGDLFVTWPGVETLKILRGPMLVQPSATVPS